MDFYILKVILLLLVVLQHIQMILMIQEVVVGYREEELLEISLLQVQVMH
nr:MAG TPA: hypothetical protein [Caudoviricetes sp.]